MEYKIYKYTNTVSGKSYIGFTNNIERRRREHDIASRSGSRYKFHRAIRKYGWDAFDLEILHESSDKDFCLKYAEPYYIRHHGTYYSGYNLDRGGVGAPGAVAGRVWINNGEVTRRVPPDQIPEGFVEGRLKTVRKIRRPWSPNRKKRRTYSGSENPASRSVFGEGKYYSTVKEAAEDNQVSPSTVQYWIRGKTKDWKFADCE